MPRLGTCYFINKEAAIKYYQGYGYGNKNELIKAVDRKLKEKEIYIGIPPEDYMGEYTGLYTYEGRYHITTD